jgi:prepilin-type N-terminal cleavage/methylation domain-containing protein
MLQKPSFSKILMRKRSGFTLIEVLVVVAIIALLVAILLPSLARARDQAQTTTCKSNLRQLFYGWTMYAQDNKGQYPGSSHDFGYDWLGYDNQGSGFHGLPPASGVIYKYMSNQDKAYTCPAHARPRWAEKDYFFYSYKNVAALTGAKSEWVGGSHFVRKNFDTDDHFDSPEHPIEYQGSAPLLIEPLMAYPNNPGLTADENSWWVSGATANRHLQSSGRVAITNAVYVDGHADHYRLPGLPENIKKRVQEEGWENVSIPDGLDYFKSGAICIKTSSGKWVTTRSVDANESAFGFMGFAPPADLGSYGYPHLENHSYNWDDVFHPGS